MNTPPLIGILGGSFDPIHLGHLHVAKHATKLLSLQACYFLLCAYPAHKTTIVSAQHRANMLKLALKNQDKYKLDLREYTRGGASLTIDSVKELRLAMPTQPLCFILGDESFNSFYEWDNWQEILNYVHLVIVNRSGNQFNPELTKLYKQKLTLQKKSLTTSNSGKIYALTIPPNPISATEIRQAITHGKNPISLLPAAVHDYIEINKLYK